MISANKTTSPIDKCRFVTIIVVVRKKLSHFHLHQFQQLLHLAANHILRRALAAAGLRYRVRLALKAQREPEILAADLTGLLQDLRGMGETNAVSARRRQPAGRTLFAEAARLYHQRHAEPDGRLPATFELLWLTGWAPVAMPATRA